MYMEQQKALITDFTNKDWKAQKCINFKRKVWERAA